MQTYNVCTSPCSANTESQRQYLHGSLSSANISLAFIIREKCHLLSIGRYSLLTISKETDRQTDRSRDRDRDRDRVRVRPTETETETETDRQTDRQTEKHTEKDRDRQRQTDREIYLTIKTLGDFTEPY